MSAVYDPNTIEEKWQKDWESKELFQNSAEPSDSEKEKIFLLFAFAYPSGAGLHVGHVESKTALDILARYHRMNGKNVFFPVGWDAFGLPAENYAIKTGIPPVVTTKTAIDTFRRQIKRLAISYDWKTEIATCHPEYYKWTQWIFLELYKKGLAYQSLGAVNWCPSCQTVLANEQVVNGHCERCGTEVIQKQMKQWFFKITEYKDELISGLDTVDWPEPTKQQQLHWIGKSSGAKVKFQIKGSEQFLSCFTTRIDTIFGVTFLVISPEKFKEFELEKIVPEKNKKATEKYIQESSKKTEEERKIGEKNKTGVQTGLCAINPASGEEVPIYIADYVLAGYGTGVVMGVPAHDDRDKAFAQKYELPIKEVIQTEASDSTELGTLINSGKYSRLSSAEAVDQIVKDHPAAMEIATTYKLRDWLISRQRYWGVPIPIVYDPEGAAHPVKEEHLPWMLPTDVEFKPTGESPLTYSKEFIDRTEKLYGKGWRPEFDTMDTFVDSSWYFMRYVDARNKEVFARDTQLKYWEPVDFYMIGPEHIVLHLLYSRFFTKFLRDQGYLNFDEPFMKMRHQGMILGPDGKKMSKSKGNVINPDEVIEKFGADTLRMYEMFMGPIEADKPWDVSAVAGVYRFLQRMYRLSSEKVAKTDENGVLTQKLHQTIKKVGEDIKALKFNTSIAAFMELVNVWEDQIKKGQTTFSEENMIKFIQLIAPFAPFIAEELYQQIASKKNKNQSVHQTNWPTFDQKIAESSSITVGVQVNGKVRAELVIPMSDKENSEKALSEAKKLPVIHQWLGDKKVIKELYVAGKIISFVTE